MIKEIIKGDRFRCKRGFPNTSIEGHIYTSEADGEITLDKGKFTLSNDEESIGNLNADFELVGRLAGVELPTYYNNDNGSLYKVASERGWNSYQFDLIKRIDRALKKGQFKEDLIKTKNLIDLWLKETGE